MYPRFRCGESQPGRASLGANETLRSRAPLRVRASYNLCMADLTQPPGSIFRLADGAWTFYVYFKGVEEEAGSFPDEQAAELERKRALRLWDAQRSGATGIID
jgi:hypothetical protein